MQKTEIKLPPKIQADVAVEIGKRACYCDPAIMKCRLTEESTSLALFVGDDGNLPDIVSKIERLIEKMSSQRLAVTPKTHRTTSTRCDCYTETVYEDLRSAGDLVPEGTGVVTRGGEFQEILTRLDTILAGIGHQHFGAESRMYNSLVPTDWLSRAGYFASFPHSVTFAMHLEEDIDQIERFAERHREAKGVTFESIKELTPPEYCLSPAVCYHTYGELSGMQLDDSDLKVVTALGRCFRYESKNITDLDRLWEFSMREIVFVGTGERVIVARARAIDLIWRLVEYLGLEARLETASDPFFSTDFKSLRFFQLANDLKYELVLPTGKKKSIAAGSFNYHENFFGNKFDIRSSDGEEAHTGCAAFGMERLALACLAQLGLSRTIDLLSSFDLSTLATETN